MRRGKIFIQLEGGRKVFFTDNSVNMSLEKHTNLILKLTKVTVQNFLTNRISINKD